MLRSTACARAEGAASASSSSSGLQYSHHVFVSFRGEDTRMTFIDHLYTALLNAGLRTFIDEDGIKRGENIKSRMTEAIKEARSSIIVFSQNYASSMWCLDELLLIHKRRKTSGHVILPVFYYVDPSQVRRQSGSFGETFARYQERIEIEIDARTKDYLRNKVEQWRDALREVADLAGMVFPDGSERCESKFIQKIVKVIADKLNRRILNVAPFLVGTESRAQNIISCLQDESADVSIVVIYGMGGIGKTTIAKLVYNLNFENFESSSFLSNIREISKQPNGLVQLQKQLLSHILETENEKINNVDEGIIRIKDAIGGKRVLIVLDDVDERILFDEVIGMRKFFRPGSKIIVTTRHRNLFRQKEVHTMHEVERLSDDESLELFSWYAFEQDHPIEHYFKHSVKVVEHCRGLPLALKVLGSSLSGKSLNEWKSALHGLRTVTNSEISKNLKISYDSLQDDHDKNLFLDIACFFNGKNKHFVSRILDECGFHTTIGLKTLSDRCLLKINEDGRLGMHQLLRDMAREIVHQECPDNVGERSRLWYHQDSYRVLRDQIGTRKIKGLFLDMRMLEEDNCSNRSDPVSNAKRARLEEVMGQSYHVDHVNSLKRRRSSFLSWLPMSTTIRNSDQVRVKN